MTLREVITKAVHRNMASPCLRKIHSTEGDRFVEAVGAHLGRVLNVAKVNAGNFELAS